MSEEEIARLHEATRATLTRWIERLRAEVGDEFPDRVTAFRPEMAVHGRYREPCPRLRLAGAAHPLRRERGQLLCPLSDRRKGAGRPGPVEAAQARLASVTRRVGRAAWRVRCRRTHGLGPRLPPHELSPPFAHHRPITTRPDHGRRGPAPARRLTPAFAPAIPRARPARRPASSPCATRARSRCCPSASMA